MTCLRCTGLMVPERFEDLDETTNQFEFLGWRCIMCGDILDPVIAGHRQIRPALTDRQVSLDAELQPIA